jgi:hypothetical protein
VVTSEPGFVERPVVFGRDRSLIGVVCQPTTQGGDAPPFVVFLSAGIIHRIGPNRLYVHLARSLARVGVPSLRFDLSGIGDSLRPPEAEALTIQERVVMDIDDAIELLQESYDSKEYIVIGLCSGADNALRTMGREARAVGGVLLDPNVWRTPGFYVRHYAHKLVSPTTWSNVLTGRHPFFRAIRGAPRAAGNSLEQVPTLDHDLNAGAWLPREVMQDHLERIVARRGRLLCLFTAGLEQYNYRNQFLRLFPAVDFDDCLTLEYYADSDHTFSRERVRERLTRTVIDWIGRNFLPSHPDPGSGTSGRATAGGG